MVLSLRGAADLHDHLAGLGKLHGIAHQVGKNLTQASRVTRYPAWHLRMHQAAQLQALLMRLLGKQFEHVFPRGP